MAAVSFYSLIKPINPASHSVQNATILLYYGTAQTIIVVIAIIPIYRQYLNNISVGMINRRCIARLLFQQPLQVADASSSSKRIIFFSQRYILSAEWYISLQLANNFASSMYRLHRTSYLCHPMMSRLNWAIYRSSLATYPSCHLDIVTSKRSNGEATSHFSSHFPADVHFRRFIQCERSHLSNKHSFWEYDEFTSIMLDFPHKFATHMQVHYLS